MCRYAQSLGSLPEQQDWLIWVKSLRHSAAKVKLRRTCSGSGDPPSTDRDPLPRDTAGLKDPFSGRPNASENDGGCGTSTWLLQHSDKVPEANGTVANRRNRLAAFGHRRRSADHSSWGD